MGDCRMVVVVLSCLLLLLEGALVAEAQTGDTAWMAQPRAGKDDQSRREFMTMFKTAVKQGTLWEEQGGPTLEHVQTAPAPGRPGGGVRAAMPAGLAPNFIVDGCCRGGVCTPGSVRKVQQALDLVPDNSTMRYVIFVKACVYRESVNVTKKWITLVGENALTTKVVYNKRAGVFDPATGLNISTGTSATFYVRKEATGFIMQDITIENDSGRPPMAYSQAVAFRVDADRCAFYYCRFISFQDTLLANGVLFEPSRQFYYGCYIEGQIDFIWGRATAIFEKCVINALGAGYVTAQSRLNMSDFSGYVFTQCEVYGSALLYLGRAYGISSRTIFSRSFLDSVVRPSGWDNFGDPAREKTAFFAEYMCYGPGSDTTKRANWTLSLTAAQAAVFDNPQRTWIDGQSWLPPTFPTSQSGFNGYPIRLTCGQTSAPFTDPSGNVWRPDWSFNTGGLAISNPDAPISGAVPALAPLFQTQRVTATGGLSYLLPTVPKQWHRIVLYFADIESRSNCTFLFNVLLNGKVIIVDLDLRQFYGPNRAVSLAFVFQAPPDAGLVTLNFSAIIGRASIAAITLDRFPVAAGAPPPTPTPTRTFFGSCFPTLPSPPPAAPPPFPAPLYINAGAYPVPFVDAIGRKWGIDRLVVPNITKAREDPGPIANAPSNTSLIYTSNRFGSRFGYLLPTQAGIRYTLTLHFAETYPLFTSPCQRVFHVTLSGSPLVSFLDVTRTAGFRSALRLPFVFLAAGPSTDLQFSAVIDGCFVSALELVPTRTALPTTPPLVYPSTCTPSSTTLPLPLPPRAPLSSPPPVPRKSPPPPLPLAPRAPRTGTPAPVTPTAPLKGPARVAALCAKGTNVCAPGGRCRRSRGQWRCQCFKSKGYHRSRQSGLCVK